jgi:CheY-like chemotaxis protein
MARLRALVADIPPAHPRIARVLGGYDVKYVTSLWDAMNALKDRAFDLIIVGIDLNESSAMVVVEQVRQQRPDARVVCIRAAESRYRLQQGTLYGFRLACQELGARGLVDFFEFPDNASGDAAIAAELEKLRSLAEK